ncbi:MULTISPECIES: MFS transporter [Asticcacaulis]|uniref:MFS transporter n=1 Tax=Asticcacaulis TaxID=76890 RepID=UPI001AE1C99A|nr:MULTISPECIES: MFS transporter [Asticcacaulis]MBP2157524.1 multidrug resistance protein [Asticcacaulis solisilvae]MDR6798569.1 multidrug resistance protein [Asticcacaulis sp. BE141]
MPELNTLPKPADSEVDAGAALDLPPRPPASEEERNERTFFRARLLREIRHFISDNGPLAAMLAVVFVNLIGFGIIVPLMPFFANSLDAQPWQVTLMFSAYSLGQFFAEPYFGRLSDRIGRKPVLIVTTALSVAFYAALAFAPNIWAAIAIRFFSGISSGNISTIQSYVSDVSKPEQRAARMSLIGAAFSLGFIVGPAVGGFVPGDQFRAPLMTAAVLSAIACFGVIFFIRESRERIQTAPPPNLAVTAKAVFRDPVIVRVILATLCYMGAFAGLESTFGLWAHAQYGWDKKEIGAIFPLIGLTAGIMQIIVMRPLVRRYGETKVLAGGLFLFGLSFTLQALNSSELLITPIVVLGTIGQSVIFSSICAIISLATPPDKTGATLGLNMSTGAIARISGPMVAGGLFTAFGPDAPLWMGAALTIPAGLLALQSGRVQKRAA